MPLDLTKVTKKDLITALTLINDALDKLENEPATNENGEEVVTTDSGEEVTLGLGKTVKK